MLGNILLEALPEAPAQGLTSQHTQPIPDLVQVHWELVANRQVGPDVFWNYSCSPDSRHPLEKMATWKADPTILDPAEVPSLSCFPGPSRQTTATATDRQRGLSKSPKSKAGAKVRSRVPPGNRPIVTGMGQCPSVATSPVGFWAGGREASSGG